MKLIAVAALALLNGCAVPVRPARVTQVNGPDGRPAFALRCGTHVESCYSAAGDVCPHGYVQVDATDGAAVLGTTNGLIGATRHSMLIECK